MAKNLNTALSAVLSTPTPSSEVVGRDIRQDAQEYQTYLEPEDKILIAIQNYLINQEYDKANELIYSNKFGNNKGMTWHHMEQLINWVRNIYKYTNMKDLSKSYYDYRMKAEIPGVKDLRKVEVKKETLDKFVKDIEKVLRKKLSMR